MISLQYITYYIQLYGPVFKSKSKRLDSKPCCTTKLQKLCLEANLDYPRELGLSLGRVSCDGNVSPACELCATERIMREGTSVDLPFFDEATRPKQIVRGKQRDFLCYDGRKKHVLNYVPGEAGKDGMTVYSNSWTVQKEKVIVPAYHQATIHTIDSNDLMSNVCHNLPKSNNTMASKEYLNVLSHITIIVLIAVGVLLILYYISAQSHSSTTLVEEVMETLTDVFDSEAYVQYRPCGRGASSILESLGFY